MRRQLLIFLLLGACSSDDAPASPTSSGDPESCAAELCAPYTCDARFGSCRTTCAGSDECVDGYSCMEGMCVGRECIEATAADVCGGYACVHGTCAADCALGPCTEGHYCRGDTNECVPNCTSREDPSCQGYLCDLEVGECESYCLADELVCAAGYVCDPDHRCVAAR